MTQVIEDELLPLWYVGTVLAEVQAKLEASRRDTEYDRMMEIAEEDGD